MATRVTRRLRFEVRGFDVEGGRGAGKIVEASSRSTSRLGGHRCPVVLVKRDRRVPVTPRLAAWRHRFSASVLDADDARKGHRAPELREPNRCAMAIRWVSKRDVERVTCQR